MAVVWLSLLLCAVGFLCAVVLWYDKRCGEYMARLGPTSSPDDLIAWCRDHRPELCTELVAAPVSKWVDILNRETGLAVLGTELVIVGNYKFLQALKAKQGL